VRERAPHAREAADLVVARMLDLHRMREPGQQRAHVRRQPLALAHHAQRHAGRAGQRGLAGRQLLADQRAHAFVAQAEGLALAHREQSRQARGIGNGPQRVPPWQRPAVVGEQRREQRDAAQRGARAPGRGGQRQHRTGAQAAQHVGLARFVLELVELATCGVDPVAPRDAVEQRAGAVARQLGRDQPHAVPPQRMREEAEFLGAAGQAVEEDEPAGAAGPGGIGGLDRRHRERLNCHAFDDGLASNVTPVLSNATLIGVFSQRQGSCKIDPSSPPPDDLPLS